MKAARALMLLGVAGAVILLAAWAALGANTGWTKTYIEVAKTDPITEIPYSERVDRFLPGVDLLGGGLALSGALIAAGFVLSKLNPRSKT